MFKPPMELLLTADTDLISAFIARDYAAVGGWSLFITLCLLIVVGSFREWWVPGARYARLEKAAERVMNANDILRDQNSKLIETNEIAKHFFEETAPKRGGSNDGLA